MVSRIAISRPHHGPKPRALHDDLARAGTLKFARSGLLSRQTRERTLRDLVFGPRADRHSVTAPRVQVGLDLGLRFRVVATDVTACSTKIRTKRRRTEALLQRTPIRLVNWFLGRGSFLSDKPSGHGGAQSGTSEAPRPRSTRTAITSSESSSNRSRGRKPARRRYPSASRPAQVLRSSRMNGVDARIACGLRDETAAGANTIRGSSRKPCHWHDLGMAKGGCAMTAASIVPSSTFW